MAIYKRGILFVFCCIVVYFLSSFEEEIYIDGKEIVNACMAFKTFVVDDIRDFTGTVSFFIFVFPFLFLCIKRRGKDIGLNILSVFLLSYWIWRFFIRLNLC
ncbi:YjeO family protein [Brenneria izbisi]|uniref:YjeO family protein n=1 Tax=Brenneria izbisi TaxID=2939450 RepID=A0AA42C218_9GAMM|nr:YjeO family protein [Brenneria izbisi]MCV9878468.1 YjeO family protein [Brenneria izbisi]MCV9881891.1 YjeO family protein [Brenneria izbisi]